MTERMKGLVIGLVKDLQDPDSLGRIRVEFPWLGDDAVSDWARVAAPLASAQLGHFFQPELGDEALVGFEMGDVSRPYILGYLWNGDNAPPVNDPNVRMIQTVSGHKLIFDDTSGSEAITLEDASGNKMVTNSDGIAVEDANGNKITTDSDGIAVEDANGNKVTMDSDGIAVEDANGNKLTMSSDGITLESAKDVTIKGQNINLEASAQLTAKGNPIHLNP